jgi:hypothetical protein
VSNSIVERRWIETNGQWHLFKINQQDPRYGDSQPYDTEQPNNGKPTLTLAEIRDGATEPAEPVGAVKTADRQPATKKVAPAKKATAKKATADSSSSGDSSTGDATPPADDNGTGDTPAADQQ